MYGLVAPEASRGTQSQGLRLRDYATHALRLVVVAAAYYGSAKLGLEQQLVRGQVTPFWPPTGIALVALLLWGLRMWPGIALGAFLVNAPLGPSILPVLAIVAGNTIAPVCACLLLRRVRFRLTLDRLQDALALVFLGALGGMVISATIGTGVLVASEALAADDFWPTWSVWWTGDAMGILVIAPSSWPRAPYADRTASPSCAGSRRRPCWPARPWPPSWPPAARSTCSSSSSPS